MLLMFSSGDEARKAWDLLRDTYRRKMRMSGTERQEDLTWPYFGPMKFIQNLVKFRATSGKLDSQRAHFSGEADTLEEEANPVCHLLHNGEGSGNGGNWCEEESSSEKTPTYNKKQRLEEDTDSGVVLALERRMLDMLEEQQASRRNKDDDDYHFLVSLLPFMKELDKTVKLQVRMDFLKTITTAILSSTETDDV